MGVSSWRHSCISVFLLVIAISSTHSSTNDGDGNSGSQKIEKKKLHIGALIPYMLGHDQLTFHAAMKTAVRLINVEDNILKDYELTISYNDSTVSVSQTKCQTAHSLLDRPSFNIRSNIKVF